MNDIFDSIVSGFETEEKQRAVALYFSGPIDGNHIINRVSDELSRDPAEVKTIVQTLGKNRSKPGDNSVELFWGSAAECRAVAGRLVSFGLAARVRESDGPAQEIQIDIKGAEARRTKTAQQFRRSGPSPELPVAPVNLVRWDERLRCVVTVNPHAVDFLARHTGEAGFRKQMGAAYTEAEIQSAVDIFASKAEVPNDDTSEVLHEVLRDFMFEAETLKRVGESKQSWGGTFVSPAEASALLRVQERALNIPASKSNGKRKEHVSDARRELLTLALEDEDFREKFAGVIPAPDLAQEIAESVRAYTQKKLYEVEYFLRPI